MLTDAVRIYLLNGAFVRVSQIHEEVINRLAAAEALDTHRDPGYAFFNDPGHDGLISVRVMQVTHVVEEEVS